MRVADEIVPNELPEQILWDFKFLLLPLSFCKLAVIVLRCFSIDFTLFRINLAVEGTSLENNGERLILSSFLLIFLVEFLGFISIVVRSEFVML